MKKPSQPLTCEQLLKEAERKYENAEFRSHTATISLARSKEGCARLRKTIRRLAKHLSYEDES